MSKIIAAFALMIVGFILSIAVMIYGWGLEPQSWGWIMGGFVGSVGLLIAGEVVKADNS